MYATIRRIALVAAGAAALAAASRARGHEGVAQARVLPGPPALTHPAAIQPAWLQVGREPFPGGGGWTRRQLLHEYRWLEKVRSRFYRHWAWNPWRVGQFEAWYRSRRAELDRRWHALARAPG